MEIDLEHVRGFSELLHDCVTKLPEKYLTLMEEGTSEFLKTSHLEELKKYESNVPVVQITLVGALRITAIREITASEVNRLLLVPGVVIKAGLTRPKATVVCFRCGASFATRARARALCMRQCSDRRRRLRRALWFSARASLSASSIFLTHFPPPTAASRDVPIGAPGRRAAGRGRRARARKV